MPKQQKYEFSPDKLSTVDIDSIEKNSYNPKKLDTKEYQNIVKSIKVHGFTTPIIVRNNPDKKADTKYLIIDGQNRWLAAKELGYKKIPIYNEGDVDEENAKSLTIFHQVQIPFSEIDLSYLVVELADMNMELPYTETEIANFKAMAEYDFDFKREEPDNLPDDDGMVPWTIRMTPAQFQVIKQTVDDLAEEMNISEGRSLELICADFNAGHIPS